MLPSDNQMARGHVVAWSHDASGNVMCRAHTNSILDSRISQVEFTGVEVTVLTTNNIAESMYDQCNEDGNKYLLLDLLTDYHNDSKTNSLTNQMACIWSRLATHDSTAGWQIYC